MTYSLNPFDPFADDEGAVLVVPEDRDDGPVSGTPVVFKAKSRDGVRFIERRCSGCGRVMVIPHGAPLDTARLAVICPRRHESETIDVPDGFVRYTDTGRLIDLVKMREAEAWA